MAQPNQTASSTPSQDRFRQLLTDLFPAGTGNTEGNLLAALGGAIDLADTVQLHGYLGRLAPLAETIPPQPDHRPLKLVLAARGEMRKCIAASFSAPVPGDPLAAPDLEAPPGLDGLAGPQRLQRFYARHQQELSVRTDALRRRLCQMLADLSPALARLAELDQRIARQVTARLEDGLAAIPRGLAEFCGRAMTEQGGRDAVLDLARELLMEELELRLQPIYGLVEAVEDMSGAQPW